jgi:hypothetical protein
MDNIQILYASWCNEKGSDKVWGYFYVGDGAITASFVWDKPVFVFWGARGKALQLKEHAMSRDLVTLKRSKQRKGYEEITTADFLDLCPNFYQEVDNKLTFAILGGNKYKAAS